MAVYNIEDVAVKIVHRNESYAYGFTFDEAFQYW